MKNIDRRHTDFMGVNLPIEAPILEGPPAQNPYCCIADLADTDFGPRGRENSFRSDPTFTRASPGLAVAQATPSN